MYIRALAWRQHMAFSLRLDVPIKLCHGFPILAQMIKRDKSHIVIYSSIYFCSREEYHRSII
jgi:hypothetical protein